MDLQEIVTYWNANPAVMSQNEDYTEEQNYWENNYNEISEEDYV